MALGRVTLTTTFNSSAAGISCSTTTAAAFSPLDKIGSCLVCCCCFAVTLDEQPVMQIPKTPKFSKSSQKKKKEERKNLQRQTMIQQQKLICKSIYQNSHMATMSRMWQHDCNERDWTMKVIRNCHQLWIYMYILLLCHFLAVMLMLQGIAHDVIQLPLNMQALIDKDQGCQL